MRLDEDAVRETLADAWERWARRCAELTPQQWSTATRCRPWDVRGLVAHLCPSRAMFDMLTAAHTSADDIAERATSDATTLTPDDAVTRFTECAQILRATPTSKETVISYPVVGTTTLAVDAEVAMMEANEHLHDLPHAVGGARPTDSALAATRDKLLANPDPIAAIEVLAGRADPATALPAIR